MYEFYMDSVRFITGAILLLFASISDIRTRTVEDKYWLIMAFTGTGLNILYALFNAPDIMMAVMASLSPFLLLMFFMYCEYIYDKEKGFNIPYIVDIAIATLLFILAFVYGSSVTRILAYPYVMIWIFYGMYYFYLISGGADAKALMAISILVPMVPSLSGYDILSSMYDYIPIVVFIVHPSISVLMNAAMITLVLPIVWFIFNLFHGDISLKGFLGIRMDIDRAIKAKVWPMEIIDEDGKIKTIFFPTKVFEDEESVMEAYDRLKEAGMKKVWVTPKIPMIVSIFIGFIIYFIFGNIFIQLIYGL